MIRRPPRSTLSSSSAASDVYKRQVSTQSTGHQLKEMAAAEEANVSLCDSSNVAVKLMKVAGVSMWKQDIPENCGMCKASLQEPCLDFQFGEETKAGVSVAHGYCGHVYHHACIQSWVENNNSGCPQCSVKWELVQLDPVPGFEDFEGSA
eukprot:TRINITY_DN10178_c0_g1_i1.p2 TRINITY_DN10178_c0_g1~~TRINITY_DN10178_c0_g1_i1.p2  ORF type:complete len:150 (-),score=40.88 TRINITY_DN10178_c0_g1_i1:387-836(-)